MKLTLLLAMLTAIVATNTHAEEIVFPNDPRAILDVKRDLGAKGDGIADDTDALQKAIETCAGKDHNRFIYLPNGTYRITRTLVFKKPGESQGSMVGPWLIGQSRDNTIIRLADGAEGFADPAKPKEAIRGVGRPDGAKMNADFFDRTVRNLTLDTGNNPGAIGIRFYSNNTGLMKDVLIRGNGAIGLDLGHLDQNGPLLIQDVEIDGFATGISTNAILNSQTLSRITIRARELGLLHRGQVLAAEALNITAPQGIDSGGNGVLAIIDSTLQLPEGLDLAGSPPPAIKIDKAQVYAARIKTSGYAQAVASTTPAGDVKQASIEEYASHDVHTVGADAPKRGLLMTPPREPEVPLPTKAEDWVCANDFGAKAGDQDDDSAAFQQAIDEAAKRGASTVYILGGKAGDPNWYHLRQDVRIHGSVQRVMGMGFVRLLGGNKDHERYPENLGKFIIEDEPNGPKVVVLEHLQVFAPHQGFGVEVRATSRPVLLRTMGGVPIVRKGATAFTINCVGHLYQEAGSTVWARHYNTEQGPRQLGINTRNDGGRLWILGLKTEATSTKVATLNGGQTEILGVHNYNTSGVKDDVAFFLVKDATLSVAGYREVHFGGNWWKVPVQGIWQQTEHRHPPTKWQTWALLRAGNK
jgi:hypothetical protein